MRNREVAEKLYELAEISELAGENPFKVKAYSEAARVIENLPIAVEDLSREGRLEEIKGVGKGIAEKIQEFLDKGVISKLEELKKKVPESLIEMGKIPGLGAKRVMVIYKQLGIKSIDELKEAVLSHKVREIEGFGPKLEENILRSIAEVHDKRGTRFLLGVAYSLAKMIVDELRNKSPVEKILICGSLRRMKETIGDIDILVTSTEPARVMDCFVNLPVVKSILAHGETKSSVITFEGIQVDVRVVETASFGASVQYFTGSKEHNVRLREIAIKKNLKLNEYGLFDIYTGKRIAGATEEEVYEALGLQFIPPEMREDRGEIELALNGKIPKLVELSDIKGDLHVHSEYSDGSNSIEELAEEAIKRGYEYIVISDHARALGVAHGLSLERFAEQKREIEALNRKLYPFRIFQGVELNILSDGNVDFDEKVLDSFDVCIAGVHTGMSQSKEKITKRVLRALQNKKVLILAHPTGRILNSRAEYDIDIDKVFEEVKNLRKILEINAAFERLDLNDINARKAVKDYGLELSIGTDAHSVASMSDMIFGVGVARRAWLTKNEIINTLSCDELEEKLRKGT